MLPDGYDIRLGPGFAGVNLSVGQSHKIVLARLFFRNAPLMIGDEPISRTRSAPSA